MIFISCE